MKDRIMASINGISPVYVCTDSIAFAFIVSENLCLVGTGVGPQYGIFVDIVRIRTTSARVVFGKAKRIEVLSDCDDRMKIIVVCIYWRGEIRFDDLARYCYWM